MYYVTSIQGSLDPGGRHGPKMQNQYAAARRRQMRLSSTPGKVWVGPLHQPAMAGNYADFTMVNFVTKRPSFDPLSFDSPKPPIPGLILNLHT